MNSLIRLQGVLPFLAAVFLNAFLDLGHKITVQNTIFKLYEEQQQIIATAVLNALILLPFILMLSPAGFITDRFRRAKVLRSCAWVAFALCGLIWFSYAQGWFVVAFTATLLLAVQSAIFSPAKFAFIKELFGTNRLTQANGFVASLSIIAILAGTFAFSVGFEMRFHEGLTSESDVLKVMTPLGFMLTLASLLELICMYRIPTKPEFDRGEQTQLRFDKKAFVRGQLFARDLAPLKRRSLRLAVIGLSTFWAIGQVMLAAFPAYFKTTTGIDNAMLVQGILACSGVGIALGAFVAGQISKGRVELGVLPLASIGISIGLMILPSVTTPAIAAFTFLAIGFCGGLFIVPLNALIQFQAGQGELGKTLAANNWVQNVAMFSFLALTVGFAVLDISSQTLLYLNAVVALVGCGYTLYQLPQSLLRTLLIFVMKNRYRVEVQGLRNMPAQGGVLLLGNHVTWIDWAVMQLASPRPVRFVMHKAFFELWYLRWFFELMRCIPIEAGPQSRRALEQVREYLEAGEVVCLFPEGTLSRTGHMVEFRRGFERACADLNTDIPIVPFYLHGLWGSTYSRATEAHKGTVPFGAKRTVVVAFGEPMSNEATAEEVKQKVFELSVTSWQQQADAAKDLALSWVNSATQSPRKFACADSTGANVTRRQALVGSTAMSWALAPRMQGQNIGLILPSSVGGALATMAVLQAGRTLVHLNYSAGTEALNAAIAKAGIRTVLTSRVFIKRLAARGIDLEPVLSGVNAIPLEDLRNEIPLHVKLRAWASCNLLPAFILRRLLVNKRQPNDTAAIIFSSGSEGSPKGICLSHSNLQTNVKQVLQVLNPEPNDIVLGNLPLFHSFGLTVTQMLPMVSGIPVVFHTDPTDAVGNAKLIARYRATIMFGTSTFLRLYIQNRKVHRLMLDSLRVVVAGAEKLKPEIRDQFFNKFGKRIHEGYGATETSPVVSVNLPDQMGLQDFKVQLGCREGSVGLPLPGTSIRIVEPETLKPVPLGEAGMVLIGGAQVMQGYLDDPVKDAQVLLELDGHRWYVTGDKGKLDADGFLYIVDRYSRFAKIGGEMISLGMVEQVISNLYAEAGEDVEELELAVVSLPDDKKGEKLVLLANKIVDMCLSAGRFAEKGLSNLALPSNKFIVEEVPKLASGKPDFMGSKRLASELLVKD